MWGDRQANCAAMHAASPWRRARLMPAVNEHTGWQGKLERLKLKKLNLKLKFRPVSALSAGSAAIEQPGLTGDTVRTVTSRRAAE